MRDRVEVRPLEKLWLSTRSDTTLVNLTPITYRLGRPHHDT